MMLGIPNPYLIGGAALALACSHSYAYFKGRNDGAASVQAKYAKAADKALSAMKKGQARIDRIDDAYAGASAAQQSETREIYHETLRIIDRPVYRNMCVDADGVRLLDRAAGNANRALAGFTPSRAP